MPKIKRNKVVSLTQTDKKVSSEAKDALITKIHTALTVYPNVYVVSVQNMRNKHQQNLRHTLVQSSLFLFGIYIFTHKIINNRS
jgi:ribosomal protein L10